MVRGFLLMLALLCRVSAGAVEVQLDTPIGGWRDSRLDNELDNYVAAYPKPPVDRGGQRYRTLIRGQLKALGRERRPPTLVVNGTAIPLYHDADGRFARPYAFGSGSNSVQLSADGKALKRVQFYEANQGKIQARLRLMVTWDDPHAQVDMHIITPDGQHAFFGNPLLTNGGGFDVDSVDGAGPGIFSTSTPLPGTYLVYLNYWGNFDDGGYNFEAGRHDKHVISCTVTIITNENTADEKRETLLVPLRAIGDLRLVRQFNL